MPHPTERSPRRSFLGRLAAGAAAIGATLTGTAAPLRALETGDEFTPARHPQDDWFDRIPGKHRIFFDAITPNGAGEALTFANNYALANKLGYGLGDADLAIVICYRHWATPFAFNDAAWAKYGPTWAKYTSFTDPVTGQPPVRNVWNARGLPGRQLNRGLTVEMAAARGWHFAVCDLATRAFAGLAAEASGGNADAVYAELKANALSNTHFTAAGIVAVGRAQERGYAFSYIG